MDTPLAQEAPNRDAFTVEQNGIEPVPDAERHGTPASLFWPWAAANLSLAGVAFGVYMVGLGLSLAQAVVAGALGYVLSFFLVGVVSVAGARTGAPTMAIGRASFGTHGNKLPTFFSYVSNVGWETVLITLSSLGGAAILARVAPGTFAASREGARAGGPNAIAVGACFGVTAIAIVVVGMYGHALIMKVQKVLTASVAAVSVVYMALMVGKIDVSTALSMPSGGPGAVVGGVVFAMTLLGMGWVNCGADFSRYLPRAASAKGIVAWTTFGGVLAPMIMLVFGALLTAGNPELARAAANDPVGALAAELPTWFLVPYLLTAIGGFVSGAIMDIYSSGMSLLALGVPIRRHTAVLLDGVLMALGGFYLLFVSQSFIGTFQAFLSVIGVMMSAWVAVFLVDQWRHRARGYDWSAIPSVGWPAVLSLAVATFVGLGLITSSDPYIAKGVGFLLGERAKQGTMGAANVGVIAALVVAGVLYAATSALVGAPRLTAARRAGS